MRSSGKQLLIAVLLAPVLVYAGLKLWIHYQVRDTLTGLTAAAAPFASIRYEGIGSSLGGTLTIEGLSVQPTGFTDKIGIRVVEIETPGLGFLLNGTNKFRDGQLPERLHVSLRDVTLDMGGPMMDMLDKLISMGAEAGAIRGMPHCGGLQFLGPRQYRKMGYDSMVSDIRFGYELERKQPRMRARFNWSTRDMAALDTEFVLFGVLSSLKDMRQAAPRVVEARIIYRDDSYTGRASKFCASASNITLEEYIEAEVNQSDAAYLRQWGFVPGPGLRAAWRAFLLKPGEVRIELRPADTLEFASLSMFRPEDILAQLNPVVAVNGSPVTDLSFSLQAASGEAEQGKAALPGEPAAAATAGSRPAGVPPAEEKKHGYHVVKTSELSQYLGREVRVHAGPGTVREGILAEVQATAILVERRYASGAMTVKVPIRQIDKVEVLF